MENPGKFRLLYLPRVALDEVISMMVPFELINFSKISQRTKLLVKTLPTRKRTYKVVLKIATSFSVTVHGSEMNWELVSTQDFSKNSLIDSYSRYFQLQHIKEIYEFINRILNFSFKKVLYDVGPLISDHKSLIDWLKSQQESVEELYIVSLTSYDNDLKYLLSDVKATECLKLKTESKMHFEWDELLPKNLDSLHLDASISFQQLLRMNSSRITLQNSKLTSREIKLFLKSWMASESNLNLEFFKVYIRNIEDMDTIWDLPHQDVRYENGKIFGNEKVGLSRVFAGIEIKQSSGKTGVITTKGNGMFLILYIF